MDRQQAAADHLNLTPSQSTERVSVVPHVPLTGPQMATTAGNPSALVKDESSELTEVKFSNFSLSWTYIGGPNMWVA